MNVDIKLVNEREVRNFIRREVEGLHKATPKNLERAGKKLEEKANETAPKDTGALIASSYTRVTEEGGNKAVEVGYDVDYAGYVHGNPKLKFKRSAARHAWLEKTTDEILDELADEFFKI